MPAKLPGNLLNKPSEAYLALGAMSGTSTDGVDVCLMAFQPDGTFARFVGTHHEPFTEELRNTLLRLQRIPASWPADQDPFDVLMCASTALADVHVVAARALLEQTALTPAEIAVFGVHGQTIRHNPAQGYTFQVIDAARVAAQLRIAVVHDLRAKDVAMGGQGAPLAPSFHRAWLEHHACLRSAAPVSDANVFDTQGGLAPNATISVLNLGGFSNLSVLPAKGPLLGGDCGPANCLMDYWAQTRFSLECDRNGDIARTGLVHEALLQALLKHPFFQQPWPASTGREAFDGRWVEATINALPGHCATPSDADVMRTLLELTVRTVINRLAAQFLEQSLQESERMVLVCGGGVHNSLLIERFAQMLPGCKWSTFEDFGLPSQAVEAALFAWLASCWLQQKPAIEISTTGASLPSVAGSLFLADSLN
ncbi:MAG: anhydro-N-acetylmuramic acid kinase [Limnobacter sp.]|nr:anhydro-N-acetylmuramic acid kinase [Limnobacter sp.]